MTRKIIDVKAGRLFPFHFLVLGGVFLFAGIMVLINYTIASSILITVGVFMLTAYEGTAIDPFSKTVREYYCFFLFLKTGKAEKYSSVEGLLIHKAKITQKMFTARTMNSSTFSHIEYRAYLKLAGADKIFLLSDKNRLRLLEKAGKIARELNTTVADYAVSR